jgi:hypothetical protein
VIFLVMALIWYYQRFRGTSCLHLQDRCEPWEINRLAVAVSNKLLQNSFGYVQLSSLAVFLHAVYLVIVTSPYATIRSLIRTRRLVDVGLSGR